MREKLIELIQQAVDGCATYWAGLIADHLIANGVTFATQGIPSDHPNPNNKSKTPRIVKRQFCYDSVMGWYISMQIDWCGQSWFLAQQIPPEPSEYINAVIKNALKEKDDGKE